jgi:hypothetical protein
MPSCRISTVGQERRVVDFNDGETLGGLFGRVGIELPHGAGVEVWVNGEKADSWSNHRLVNDDAVVLMPNLKGASQIAFVCRLKST